MKQYRTNPFQNSNITTATGIEKMPTESIKAEAEMILEQTTIGIKENLEIGKNEFVIKLKPEGLGEITVKMAEQGSKMVLSIVTSSEQTGRLLNNQLNVLRESLRPYNAEVENVVTQSSDVSSYLSSGGDFNSFAREQMFQQQQEQNRGFSNERSFIEEVSEERMPEALENSSALDVHI